MRKLSFLMVLALSFAACSSGSQSPETSDFERQDVEEEIAAAAAPDRCKEVRKLAKVSRRGLYGFRSPEIVPIPKEPNFIGGETTLVHSGPWDYLTHVPWLLYGPGHIEPVGDVDTPATLADVAPTTAELIGFDSYQAPDGKAKTSALAGGKPPRLVISIVWDGGGWNALDRHANKWPFLKKLTEEGASYTRFSVGSSPSVTPATHTNLGTGAFPASHGIVGLNMRTKDFKWVNPLGGKRPDNIEVKTLSDRYDRARGNKPVTGMLGSTAWHIGMIGHGAALNGADRDPVALMSHNDPEIKTNPSIYDLPRISNESVLADAIDDVDAADGKRDGKWLKHPLDKLKDAWKSPALTHYTQYLLERLIVTERFGRDRVPDLLYVNFKGIDLAGHAWSYNSKEVAQNITAADDALKRLVSFLNRKVGKGEWVVMVTADHGMTPYPKDSGAWPVRGGELADDLNRKFDTNGNDQRLIDRVGAAGIFVRPSELESNGVTLEELAEWVGDYRVGENLKEGQTVPSYYEGTQQDRIFEAVLAKRKLVAPATCTKP